MRLLDSLTYKQDLSKGIGTIDLKKLNGKSIFITGGLGLIASTIIDILITYGKIGMIYVGARNKEKFDKRYEKIENLKFIYYDALEPIKIDIKPDYIIAGAGLASPELYTKMPVETMLSNIEGIKSLLQFAMNNPVTRILYISSSEVYGNRHSEDPFIESDYGEVDLDSLRSSYSEAKRAAEMICKSYMSEYKIDMVIVRPGHIFGPSAKREDRRISSDFAFKAAIGESLEMKSLGLQKRSYCYSVDCGLQILTVLLNGVQGNAYNIGQDKAITIREMVEILAKAGNVKFSFTNPTESEKAAFNPMNHSVLSTKKIEELGFKNVFSVEDGLTHTVKILREIMQSNIE